jgi:Protein of unknown function (DUF2946)
MTYRSTTRGKSVWARVAAWFAAYAFVLQTVLAPIAAAAATRAVPADTQQIVLCAEHAQALDQNQDQPVAPHDHEAICKFCVGCPSNALLAPEAFASTAAAPAITPIRWYVASHLVPDRDDLAGNNARGPPAQT